MEKLNVQYSEHNYEQCIYYKQILESQTERGWEPQVNQVLASNKSFKSATQNQRVSC